MQVCGPVAARLRIVSGLLEAAPAVEYTAEQRMANLARVAQIIRGIFRGSDPVDVRRMEIQEGAERQLDIDKRRALADLAADESLASAGY
jgi:hypothetical protein